MKNIRKQCTWQDVFWSYVKKETDEKCWEWTGSYINGYGIFCIPKIGNKRAHVVAWFLAHAIWPNYYKNEVIRHYTCRNKLCCNVNHLKIGTQADNIADRERHGTTSRGEKHSRIIKESLKGKEPAVLAIKLSPSIKHYIFFTNSLYTINILKLSLL